MHKFCTFICMYAKKAVLLRAILVIIVEIIVEIIGISVS